MSTARGIAEVLRRIQLLNSRKNKSADEIEELDFYKSLITGFNESLENKVFYTLIPITFKTCPISKAKYWALDLGLNIVEGSSGTTYLSISEGLKY